MQNGGARLAPELRQRLMSRFHCKPQEIYGTAEGLINMTRLDDPDELLLHSSGSPVCEADEIKVVDDFGNEVPDGETGELLTRGPYTIRGGHEPAMSDISRSVEFCKKIREAVGDRADLLFGTLARAGVASTAAVLSGFGADGAKGLKLLRDQGSKTFVQSPDTAMVSQAPEAALAADGADAAVSQADQSPRHQAPS